MTERLPEALLRELTRVCREIAAGKEGEKERFFELTRAGSAPPYITDLAESFGMMLVKVETRKTAYDPDVANACIWLFRTGRFSFGS